MKDLLALVSDIIDYQGAQALAGWDQDCHMPNGGADARARMMATLEKAIHRKICAPALLDAATRATESEDERERTIGRYWVEEHTNRIRVPEALAGALAEASSRGTSAWRDATTFEEVLPAFDTLVRLSREYAACFPEKKAYDTLIDRYEPRMTQASIDGHFAILGPALRDLRARTGPTQGVATPVRTSEGPMLTLCKVVTASLGFDYTRGNIATTEHPFMMSLTKDDVRIATSRRPDDPLFMFTSAIHEAGHGMYEQGAGDWVGTGIDYLRSSALHESQSLFFEIMVGKSRSFWQRWAPALNAVVDPPYKGPDAIIHELRRYDPDNVIRLQAGDLDYGLHILLRYDVERDLFSGAIEARDVRDRFNEGCRTYFGRVPKEDRREGVFQDVHWPAGMFGYFPSYLLGIAFSAQLAVLCEIMDAHHTPEDTLAFLRRTVHQHAGQYTFTELTDQFGGFDPTHYLSYLKRSYAP